MCMMLYIHLMSMQRKHTQTPSANKYKRYETIVYTTPCHAARKVRVI